MTSTGNKKKIRGVGLILLCQRGQDILTIKELTSKPGIHKKAGMISFPLETVNEGEDVRAALQRLLVEEIGIRENQITAPDVCGIFTHVFDTCIVHYTMYMAQCKNGNIVHQPEDDDIVIHGWMRPSDLMDLKQSQKRIEVSLFLDECFNNGRACA